MTLGTRIGPRIGLRIGLTLLTLGCALNYPWVHAATVAALAADCDPSLLAPSNAAVAKLYGAVRSNPVIKCIDSPKLGLQVSHGRTNFAPGLPTVILIGPLGDNVDVVAHEWAHAELFERLGFVQRQLRIPTWLDEGLAMQVDHRPTYNRDALQRFHQRSDLTKPTLASMNASNFFAPGDQGKFHYAYSKCLVYHWISNNRSWLDQLQTLQGELPPSLTHQPTQCH